MTKLYFPLLKPLDEPIDSLEALQAFTQKTIVLIEKAKQAEGTSFEKEARYERTSHLRSMSRRMPHVVVARCPFCQTLILEEVTPFSLDTPFFGLITLYSGRAGRSVDKKSTCEHLFSIDGALNLNGYEPTELVPTVVGNLRTIYAGAEVPFVKPRVLNLSTMVAVLHQIPIAGRYTALPVTYFAERLPPQADFCVPWLRQEYTDGVRDGATGLGGEYIATRSDVQDYELAKWVAKGKVYWLGSEKEAHPLRQKQFEQSAFANMQGRKHPYLVWKKRVYNLPQPAERERRLLALHGAY